jgi:hypothetical protein
MIYWINVYRDYGQVWHSPRHATRDMAIAGAFFRKPLYRIKVTPK